MDAGTGFTNQVWDFSHNQFLPKDWIVEQWEDGYYITCLAGSAPGASLVVMSKGTPYTQQSYKVSDSFPFKWINKKWKEGFYVTSMATSGTRWAVVMSRNAGFVDQCVELDFMYPSEGIHRRWDGGFRITCCAATPDQAAFVLSIPRRRPLDETQETLRTSAFPSTHVKEKWSKNLYSAIRPPPTRGYPVASCLPARLATPLPARELRLRGRDVVRARALKPQQAVVVWRACFVFSVRFLPSDNVLSRPLLPRFSQSPPWHTGAPSARCGWQQRHARAAAMRAAGGNGSRMHLPGRAPRSGGGAAQGDFARRRRERVGACRACPIAGQRHQKIDTDGGCGAWMQLC